MPSEWLLGGLVALGWAYPCLLAHELSHVLWARLQGATIVEFRPWPHRSSDGVLRFGAVYWVSPKPLKRSVYAAPLWSDLIFGSAGLLLGWLVWPPLFGIAACHFVDTVWWLRGFFGLWSKNKAALDGWKWRQDAF